MAQFRRFADAVGLGNSARRLPADGQGLGGFASLFLGCRGYAPVDDALCLVSSPPHSPGAVSGQCVKMHSAGELLFYKEAIEPSGARNNPNHTIGSACW